MTNETLQQLVAPLANAIHDLAIAIRGSSQVVGSTSTMVSGETCSQVYLEALAKMKTATEARERVVFTEADASAFLSAYGIAPSYAGTSKVMAIMQLWLDKALGQ